VRLDHLVARAQRVGDQAQHLRIVLGDQDAAQIQVAMLEPARVLERLDDLDRAAARPRRAAIERYVVTRLPGCPRSPLISREKRSPRRTPSSSASGRIGRESTESSSSATQRARNCGELWFAWSTTIRAVVGPKLTSMAAMPCASDAA